MANERSKVQSRKHLALDPKPMYVENAYGQKCLRDIGLPMTQARSRNRLDVKDATKDY